MSLVTRALEAFSRRGKVAPSAEEKTFGSSGPLPPSWPSNWFQIGLKDTAVNNRGGSTVSGIVAAYAQTIAQCPAHRYRVLDDLSRQRMYNSGPALLLHRPNSYQTRSDFLLNLISGLLYEGNGYIVLNGETPKSSTEMHLLDPRQTRPERIGTPNGNELFYSTGGQWAEDANLDGAVRIPARNIGHLRLFTPHDPLIGVTPIAAAGDAIAASNAIASSTAAFHTNASRPSGVLTTELNLSKEQMVMLREAWEDQAKSLNSGGVPILSNGLSWSPLSISNSDAETVETWRMSVEEICRAFNIPQPVVGALEDATLNNAETLIQLWLSMGLGFMVEHTEAMLSKMFNLGPDQGIELDTSVLLRTNFEGRMAGLAKAVSSGIYSPNEVRRREHLPPVEGGEEPRVQQQNVPLSWDEWGGSSGGNDEPPPVEDITDDEIDEALENA